MTAGNTSAFIGYSRRGNNGDFVRKSVKFISRPFDDFSASCFTACFENNKKLLKSIKKRKETETAAGAKRGKTNGSRDPIAFDLAIYWLR